MKKIIYITTKNPNLQGDFLEVSMLNGLRQILGDNVIDFPRKKVMYGDFSESPKQNMHGLGLTYHDMPIQEASNYDFEVDNDCVILYGVTSSYGVVDIPDFHKKAKAVFYLDGRDDTLIHKTPCFKRELTVEDQIRYKGKIKSTGFGIPEHLIMPIDFSIKTQMHQKTWPKEKILNSDYKGDSEYIFDNKKTKQLKSYKPFYISSCSDFL